MLPMEVSWYIGIRPCKWSEALDFQTLHRNQRGKTRGSSGSISIRCLPWCVFSTAGKSQSIMHGGSAGFSGVQDPTMFMCLAICTCAYHLVIFLARKVCLQTLLNYYRSSRRQYFSYIWFEIVTKQLLHLLFSWKPVRYLNLVNARPSHVENISLPLYSLLVEFASALVRFAQVALLSRATIRPVFGVHVGLADGRYFTSFAGILMLI